MRRLILTYSLSWFLVVGLCPIAVGKGAVGVGAVSDDARSLPSLVREYVRGSSDSSQDQLLSQILRHSDASLETVEAAILDVRQYSKAPVGVQRQRSVRVKGQKASYGLYVPPAYDPKKSYPMILCLHGAGFTGRTYLDRWVPRLDDRYILACPTIAMGAWWTRFGEDLALATLRAVQAEYHIDRTRVF